MERRSLAPKSRTPCAFESSSSGFGASAAAFLLLALLPGLPWPPLGLVAGPPSPNGRISPGEWVDTLPGQPKQKPRPLRFIDQAELEPWPGLAWRSRTTGLDGEEEADGETAR